MPLLDQPQAFNFEMRVFSRQLCAELAHCVDCPLEELLAESSMLPRMPKHVVNTILRRQHRRRALERFAPSWQGAGDWRPHDRWPDLTRDPYRHRLTT